MLTSTAPAPWPRGERRASNSAPPQPKRVGLLAKEPDHLIDVFTEGQAHLLGAPAQVIAVHGAREGLVLHSLDHRGRLEVHHAPARTHERRGRNEARHLVAGEQGVLKPRLARDAAVLSVRQDRPGDPLWIS